jgi:TonB family protein
MQGVLARAWMAGERSSSPGIRLAMALAISLLAHALFLNWHVHVPGIGEFGSARRSSPPLKVSFKPQADEPAPVREETPVPVEPAASNQVPSPVTTQAAAKPVEPITPRTTDSSAPEAASDAVPLVGYYPVSRLTRMPEAISKFDIKAPSGGDTGLGGKMTIRIWISAKGAIDRVRVLSSGLPADYGEAALAAFEKLRFSPGEIDGAPVQAWADIVIEYADFRQEPVK